jgi:hypothetical protein
MPRQSPSTSKQDYETPRELLDACASRWGALEVDRVYRGVALTPAHRPARQASDCVQASLSLHGEASVFAGLLQMPVMLSHTPASWH